ncbi:MAG: hypothetical protein QXN55_00885 [Candidatus Nitrosotenuis sp.]
MKTPLAEVVSGSHLFGTATPTSDRDFKVIYLPNLNRVLLERRSQIEKRRPIGVKDEDPMPVDEAEYEFIPLKMFAEHFFEGQTYAIETAFVIANTDSDLSKFVNCYDARIVEFCNELINDYLTADITKMIQYAMSQAELYGDRASRLNAVETVIKLIEKELNEGLLDESNTLGSIVDKLVDVKSEFIFITKIKDTKTGYNDMEALSVNNRTYALTTKVGHFLNVMRSLRDKYGKRVRKAQGDEVDWKALSHAIRIAEEALDILTLGKISFPRESAKHLLEIKNGKVPFDRVKAEFEELNERVSNAQQITALPFKDENLKKDFYEWLVDWIRTFYDIEYN